MRKLWKRAAALVVSAALAGAMLPSAFSEEATDAVEAKLTTMTLREKVGQLFWVRPETLDFSLNPEKKTLTQTMRQNLEQYPVGGIAVFKKNIQDENQLSSLIADFQSASKIPMIVAVDEEGGAVAGWQIMRPSLCLNIRAPGILAKQATRSRPARWDGRLAATCDFTGSIWILRRLRMWIPTRLIRSSAGGLIPPMRSKRRRWWPLQWRASTSPGCSAR